MRQIEPKTEEIQEGLEARLGEFNRAQAKVTQVYQERYATALQRYMDAVRAAGAPWLEAPARPASALNLWRDANAYWIDFAQRSVLFWDTLRQRGNNWLEHEKAGKPPLLNFEWEMVADARKFERPVNYALVRIIPPADVQTDASRRPFVIIEKETGSPVGSTRYLDIQRKHRTLEIGSTWLAKRVWRSRVNTECKYLLLRHAFEELKVMRVQLKTDRRNTRSRAAIERIGGRFEGILRHHMLVRGDVVRDSAYYGFIDSEWPEVKASYSELFVNDDCAFHSKIMRITPGSRTRKGIQLPGPMHSGEQLTVEVTRTPRT